MGKLIDADALKKRLIQQRDKVELEKKYGWEWTYNGLNGAVFMVGAEAAKNGIDAAAWIPCSRCERKCEKWGNLKTSQE